MNSADSCVLSGVNWSVETDMFLADFVERVTLPHLALITKGQYLSIGAPNLANPVLKPYVLIHSRQKVRKVLGQVVKMKDNRRAIITEHKVAIPEHYDGFFEILSEDGRPVKCIETVRELAKAFPELALVRTPCKAYLPDNDGELRNLYKTRQVEESEILTLVGQFNFKRDTFLRCFDETGHSVYMKMTQKCKFSPIARKDAITGVHYIRNLLDAKRFPLTVKLIQGSFPPEFRRNNNEPVILRLQSAIQEDIVMAYVLQKTPEFLSVPINAHLKVAPSSNHPQIVCRPEFRQLCEACEEILPTYLNRITPITDHQISYNLSSGLREFARISKYPGTGEDTLGTNLSGESSESNGDRSAKVSSPEPVVSDEEIDQLYDYIRGLAPLPDSCHKQQHQQQHQSQPNTPGESPQKKRHGSDGNRKKSSSSAPKSPPPPPPLETLPSRVSEDSKHSSNNDGNNGDNNNNNYSSKYVSTVTVDIGGHGGHNSKPAKIRSESRENKKRSSGDKKLQRTSTNENLLLTSPVSPLPAKGGAEKVKNRKERDRHKHISKSTEKLLHTETDAQNARINGPHHYVPGVPNYNISFDGPAGSGAQNGLGPHQGDGVNGKHLRSKQRPMSMVLPDNITLFPASHLPPGLSSGEYFKHFLANPPGNHHQQGGRQQQRHGHGPSPAPHQSMYASQAGFSPAMNNGNIPSNNSNSNNNNNNNYNSSNNLHHYGGSKNGLGNGQGEYNQDKPIGSGGGGGLVQDFGPSSPPNGGIPFGVGPGPPISNGYHPQPPPNFVPFPGHPPPHHQHQPAPPSRNNNLVYNRSYPMQFM